MIEPPDDLCEDASRIQGFAAIVYFLPSGSPSKSFIFFETKFMSLSRFHFGSNLSVLCVLKLKLKIIWLSVNRQTRGRLLTLDE